MTVKPNELDGRSARAMALREERRAQILAAALQVFGDEGYHRASVASLVQAAGVARGTFYLYFDSKQAVFLELLDSLLTAFRGTVTGVNTDLGAPALRDQLIQTTTRILEAADQQHNLARILLEEAVGLNAEVEQRLRAFESELHDYIAKSMSNGKRLGWFGDHVDEQVAASCVYGSIRQLLVRRICAGHTNRPPAVVATAFIDVQLRGLMP